FSHLPDVRKRSLLIEEAQRGERGGAGERVPGIAVPVEEGLLRFEGAEEALVDRVCRDGRGERQVSAGESLGEAEDVRDDLLLLGGEQAPGAAEPRGHLVADEQDAVVAAGLGDAAQVPGRM